MQLIKQVYIIYFTPYLYSKITIVMIIKQTVLGTDNVDLAKETTLLEEYL